MYTYDPTQKTYMAVLVEKYRKERERDEVIDKIIEKLQHYKDPAPGEETNLIGLGAKMEEGGRSELLPFALSTKELFAKKILKHQFSETAQEIHAYLLAEVYTRFYNLIFPCIGKIPDIDVNNLIQEKIINYIQGILGENVLDFYSDEINGMLYFLTGNCHIRWKN